MALLRRRTTTPIHELLAESVESEFFMQDDLDRAEPLSSASYKKIVQSPPVDYQPLTEVAPFLGNAFRHRFSTAIRGLFHRNQAHGRNLPPTRSAT